MRCREASVGALVQVVGLAVGALGGSPLVLLSGPLAGLAAGAMSDDPALGARYGGAGSAMGLAGFGLSVLVVGLVGAAPALPSLSPAVVVAGAVAVFAGGVAGGTVGSWARTSLRAGSPLGSTPEEGA